MKYKNWEIIKKPVIINKGGGWQCNKGIRTKYRWSAKRGDLWITGCPSLATLKEEINFKEKS